MAGGITCMFPSDYGTHTSFFAQVNNKTNSIYSNLYLNYPFAVPGIALLQTAIPDKKFFLDGNDYQGCNRKSPLVQIKNDTEYGVQIVPNEEGRAALRVIKNELNPQVNFWTLLTDAFYVQDTLHPLSLAIPNAGSYYACTDGLGDINVYFRLNTTSTPLVCEDILLDIKL